MKKVEGNELWAMYESLETNDDTFKRKQANDKLLFQMAERESIRLGYEVKAVRTNDGRVIYKAVS